MWSMMSSISDEVPYIVLKVGDFVFPPFYHGGGVEEFCVGIPT